MTDKQLRYEDSINALRGAIAEGMVPGGGSCLAYMVRFADECRATIPDPDERAAVDVLIEGMGVPTAVCRAASLGASPHSATPHRTTARFVAPASIVSGLLRTPPPLRCRLSLGPTRSRAGPPALPRHPRYALSPPRSGPLRAQRPAVTRATAAPPQAPVTQIARNAGLLGELVREKVSASSSWGYGFNAKTLVYEDLFAAGVCDPVTVTTWALENAASISGSMLTTEALITNLVRDESIDEDFEPEFGGTGMGKDIEKYTW